MNRFYNAKVPSKLIKKESVQTADNVEVLTGVEAIRRRISYYMGSKDAEAIFQCFKELFDNSADEANANRNDFIGVWLNGEQTIVWDRGGGIPIEVHKDTGQPVLIDLFTKLHSGGKLSNDGAYASEKGTAGTHGVGVKATNALSSKLEVWTFRNGKWYYVAFKKGKLLTALNSKTPIPVLPVKIKHGTIIRMTPDFEVFEPGSKLSIKKVKDYCQLKSFIHPGLEIYLKTPKNEYTFQEKDGLKALLNKQVQDLEDDASEELGAQFILQKGAVDIAFSWTKNSGELITSYVSGSNTKDGGTHITGLYDAIRDALKPYKESKEFIPAEARDGLVGIMNVAVIQPQFSSQDKRELKDARVTKTVYDLVKPALDDFFAKNKTLVKTIVAKADLLHKRTEKFKTDKKDIAQLKSPEAKMLLASKLRGCRTKDISKRELFIVEGDSAGGTAKQGSDKEYQMILPLRGKVLNAYKKEKLLFKNAEVLDIFRSIGILDPNIEDPVKALKTNKIVLLTDPDVDGKHITNLILSLFQKIVPETFISEHIFIVDAPLFNSQLSNGKKIYGGSIAEVEAQFKKLSKKIPPEGVQRIKGWGEVSPSTLKEIAFNPLTRKLTRITAPKTKEEEQEFASIVGEDAGERRKLLKV